MIFLAGAKSLCRFARRWKKLRWNQSIHARCLCKSAAIRVDYPDPVRSMFTGANVCHLFGEGLRSVLAKIRTYGRQLVSQNFVVFGERVTDNDRIKDPKSTRQQ